MKNNTLETQEPRILIVEDGSVDINELQQFIDDHKMPVYILVYRQGSTPPKWLGE